MWCESSKVNEKRGENMYLTEEDFALRSKLQITFYKTSFFLSPRNFLEDYNLIVIVNSGLISEVSNSKIFFVFVGDMGVQKCGVGGLKKCVVFAHFRRFPIYVP